MKRKFLSVLLIVVLACSFSLVTAVPAMASPGTLNVMPIPMELNMAGGFVEWSTAKSHTGSDSIHLGTTGVAGSEARANIVASSVGVDTLADIDSISWWEYLEQGYPPHVDIGLDIDGNGSPDDWLVIEYAYNTSEGDVRPEGQPSYGALTGAWYRTFSDDGNGPVAIGDGAYAWLNSQAAGPVGGEFGADGHYGATLADWKVGLTVPEVGEILASTVVTHFVIEVDNWRTPLVQADVYVDDIAFNVNGMACFGSIQHAVGTANPDDTISVAAGTYTERVDINKSLTLEGANAGIPGSGTRGPESIINPQSLGICDDDLENDFGVIIYGADTIATFDGFTVENYHRAGILAGGYTTGQDVYPNPSVVHILNNIVSEPIGEHNNNCIQMGFGTTGTIIGNEVFGAVLESPDYSGSGILVQSSNNVLVSNNYVHDCEGGIQTSGWPVAAPTETKPPMGPAEDSIIEYNLVQGNESGIVAQQNSIGTIIRYNDALNNARGIVSVGYFNSPGYFPSGTQIHYNNIVGNLEYGVRSYAWDDGGPEQVDAKYNWWDDETGPEHATLNPGAQGDAVSDSVDFSPWLYETKENFVSDAPSYAGSVVIGNEATLVEGTSYDGGWNSFSTPVTLDGSADSVSELLDLVEGSGLSIVRAQRFDLASQEWIELVMGGELTGEDYEINPGEGFFIQVSTKGSLPILCSTNPTSPPRTDLVAGWNLVGLSDFTGMQVVDALNIVEYSVVLSASPPNAESWSVPPGEASTSMQLGEAYWLGMSQPGILFGHTTTPVAAGMTWDLNQN